MVGGSNTTALTVQAPAQLERRVLTFSRAFQTAPPRPPTPVRISSVDTLYSGWLPITQSIIQGSGIGPYLRPPVQSRLRITNRSFQHAAPQFWNKLPHSLRVPYQSGSSLSSSLSSGSNPEPAVNLSHGMFHSRLKTYLFSKSFPLSSPLSHGLITW